MTHRIYCTMLLWKHKHWKVEGNQRHIIETWFICKHIDPELVTWVNVRVWRTLWQLERWRLLQTDIDKGKKSRHNLSNWRGDDHLSNFSWIDHYQVADSSPAIDINTTCLHGPSTQPDYSIRLHNPSTRPVYSTRLHTRLLDPSKRPVYSIRVNDPSTRLVSSIRLHYPSTRTVYTSRLHEPSTRPVYTTRLYDPSTRDPSTRSDLLSDPLPHAPHAQGVFNVLWHSVQFETNLFFQELRLQSLFFPNHCQVWHP